MAAVASDSSQKVAQAYRLMLPVVSRVERPVPHSSLAELSLTPSCWKLQAVVFVMASLESRL